jgi:hypothetical protein
MSDPEPRDASFDVIPPRVVRATLALATVLAVAGAVGTAFSPYLLVRHPLALLALSADARHVLLVTGQLDLFVVLAVALPRRVIALVATYGFGAIYGRAALRWADDRSPRVARVTRFVERILARVGGPLLLVWPGYTLSLLSGARRGGFGAFVLLIIAGQTLQIVLTYFFGEAISEWTAYVLAFLREHMVASTAVCVAAVAVQQAIGLVRRHRSRARDAHRRAIAEVGAPVQGAPVDSSRVP